ncbi:MAG: hypothetical protein K2L51_04725 [Clostridiales bacterium]|nr:hypothetical protein [Clostridiales bacterium]
MIQALKSMGHNQCEYARWCENEREKYKVICVEEISENEKRWSTVLQNIITTAGSTLLRTAFAYPYDKRQHIFYRNEWWEITNAGEVTTDVNPQNLGLVTGGNMQYILEVVQVDGYDAD